jgi:hypothetical protein
MERERKSDVERERAVVVGFLLVVRGSLVKYFWNYFLL